MQRPTLVIVFVLVLVTRFRLSDAQCATGSRFGCANCTHVNICSYDGSVVTSYRCDSADPSRPFCSGNTGRCVSRAESQCIQPSELCPRKSDVFPHPTNCFRYVFCDADQVAYEFTCPRNYVYDHSIQGCKYRRASRDCFQINCGLAANRNQWVSYQPAPRLAVFCSLGLGPLTFECEHKYDAFNVATRSCSFRCPFVGQFPVAGDPTKYYSCTRGRYNTLILSELTCPDGLAFDESISSCSIPPTTTTLATTAQEPTNTQAQEQTTEESSAGSGPAASTQPEETTSEANSLTSAEGPNYSETSTPSNDDTESSSQPGENSIGDNQSTTEGLSSPEISKPPPLDGNPESSSQPDTASEVNSTTPADGLSFSEISDPPPDDDTESSSQPGETNVE